MISITDESISCAEKLHSLIQKNECELDDYLFENLRYSLLHGSVFKLLNPYRNIFRFRNPAKCGVPEFRELSVSEAIELMYVACYQISTDWNMFHCCVIKGEENENSVNTYIFFYNKRIYVREISSEIQIPQNVVWFLRK